MIRDNKKIELWRESKAKKIFTKSRSAMVSNMLILMAL